MRHQMFHFQLKRKPHGYINKIPFLCYVDFLFFLLLFKVVVDNCCSEEIMENIMRNKINTNKQASKQAIKQKEEKNESRLHNKRSV